MSSELKWTVLFYGGIVLVILLLVVGASGIKTLNTQDVEITIEDKWIKATNDGSNYMISDTNGNVYEVDDSLWLISFDASNRYAGLDIDRSYGVTTIGWRVPFLSMYTNIVEVNYGIMEVEKYER